MQFFEDSSTAIIRESRNNFLKQLSNLNFTTLCKKTPETLPGKLTKVAVKVQHLPDIEQTDPKYETSCPKLIKNTDTRKVYANCRERLILAKNHFRTNSHIKDNEVDLKVADFQNMFANGIVD